MARSVNKKLVSRRELLRSARAGSGLLCLSAFTGWTPAIAQSQTLQKVSIVTSGGPDSLVMIELMKRLDLFKQFGIEGEFAIVSDGNKAMSTLVGGTSDICVGQGFAQVFPAIEHGGTLKVLASVSNRPPTAIFSKRPDIKTVHDLAGKTVGIAALGSLYHELMLAILAKKSVDPSKVNFVNVGSSPDIFRAVVAGTIDAGIGNVDVYEQQQKYGVHSLSDGVLWVELPEFTSQGSFASQDAIANNRDALVRTLAAFAKVYRYISTPEARDIFVSSATAVMNSTDETEAITQWNYIQKYKPFAVDLVMSQERVDYIQQLNKAAGIQKTILPYDKVTDMSLSRDAIKLLG